MTSDVSFESISIGWLFFDEQVEARFSFHLAAAHWNSFCWQNLRVRHLSKLIANVHKIRKEKSTIIIQHFHPCLFLVRSRCDEHLHRKVFMLTFDDTSKRLIRLQCWSETFLTSINQSSSQDQTNSPIIARFPKIFSWQTEKRSAVDQRE